MTHFQDLMNLVGEGGNEEGRGRVRKEGRGRETKEGRGRRGGEGK